MSRRTRWPIQTWARTTILTCAATLVALSWAAPTALAGSESGNTLIRILGTVVDPDTDATVSTGPASDADVSTEFIPAATISYFLNPNLAVELFCCFAKHQADAKGDIAGLGEIADFWIFPPALTLQYHFTNFGAFKPYVGAGVQYIAFFNEKTNITDTVDIDNAFGFTLQAGFDYSLGNGWYMNADVKKTFIETDVTWANAGVPAVTANVAIDPWIFSAGLGYRFNLEDVLGAR